MQIVKCPYIACNSYLLYIIKMSFKNDLRVRAKSIRQSLDMNLKSSEAVVKIRNSKIYNDSKNVLLFYPMKYEINLLELVNDDKNFYLPKVCGDELFICPFKNGDKLVKSAFNIREPCGSPVDAKILDLAIVPALMVDKSGFRLGYGGGFYDRFLAQYPDLTSMVPVVKELLVDELPVEDFDIKIDIVFAC